MSINLKHQCLKRAITVILGQGPLTKGGDAFLVMKAQGRYFLTESLDMNIW